MVSHASRGQTRAQVLLATAEVHILNACGKLVVCRALLDNGSQINILTEAMAQRLGLARTKINKSITGINEVVSRAAYQVTASIKSRINNYSATLDMLVLPKITGKLPTNNIDTNKWSIPTDIMLADSRCFKPEKIDIDWCRHLLGNNVLGKFQTAHNGSVLAANNVRLDYCRTSE